MFVRKSSPETTINVHRYTVEKHGSHNQSSHGRRGGKGGGSSGSSFDQSDDGAKEISDVKISQVQSDIASAQDRFKAFDQDTSTGRNNYDALDGDDQDLISTALRSIKLGQGNLSAAKKTKNKSAKEKALGKATENLTDAFDTIDNATSEKLRSVNSFLDRALDRLDNLTGEESGSNPSF